MEKYESSQKLITLHKEGLLPQEEKLETGRKNKKYIIGVPKEIDPKKSLASIKEARFGVREAKGILWIGIAFRIIWQEKEYRPLLQISVPQVVMA